MINNLDNRKQHLYWVQQDIAKPTHSELKYEMVHDKAEDYNIHDDF